MSKLKLVLPLQKEVKQMFEKAKSDYDLVHLSIAIEGISSSPETEQEILLLLASIEADINELTSLFPDITNKRGEDLTKIEREAGMKVSLWIMKHLKTNRWFKKNGIDLDLVIAAWEDSRTRTIRLSELVNGTSSDPKTDNSYLAKCRNHTEWVNNRRGIENIAFLKREIDNLLGHPIENGSAIFSSEVLKSWKENMRRKKGAILGDKKLSNVQRADALDDLRDDIVMSLRLVPVIEEVGLKLGQMCFLMDDIVVKEGDKFHPDQINFFYLDQHIFVPLHFDAKALMGKFDKTVIREWCEGKTTIQALEKAAQFLDTNFEKFVITAEAVEREEIHWNVNPRQKGVVFLTPKEVPVVEESPDIFAEKPLSEDNTLATPTKPGEKYTNIRLNNKLGIAQ